MGFTTPCFIRKSTESLTNRIYRLGGRSGKNFWHCKYLTLLLAEEEQFTCIDNERGNADRLIERGYIDCGENEELFISLSALRDDTDKSQWFTDGDKWLKCPEHKFSTYWTCHDIEINVNTIHKASVNELIEHFKSNK